MIVGPRRDGMGAKRHFHRRLGKALDAETRAKPLPILVDQRHLRELGVKQAGGETGQPVEIAIGLGIQHVEGRQDLASRRILHNLADIVRKVASRLCHFSS